MRTLIAYVFLGLLFTGCSEHKPSEWQPHLKEMRIGGVEEDYVILDFGDRTVIFRGKANEFKNDK